MSTTSDFTRRTAIAAAVGSAAILATPAIAQSKKVIKIGTSSAADFENDNGMSCWVMQNYINGRSKTLSFETHGSSGLGSDQDVIQALQLGSGATMHIGGTALFNTFIPRVGVLDLPFMWKDYDHVGRVLDGEVGKALAGDFEKAGFKVVGWGYSWGYRNVMTRNKTVEQPGDLAGLKIRTIQSPIYVAALNAMGANATPMAFGETYTALQTGVLDGFEHAASMVVSAKLYEVTKNVALTRHLFGPTVATYSLPLWKQLTDEERKTVEEAAALAIEINRAMAPVREKRALDTLAAKGMTIKTVDTKGYAAKAEPLQVELATKIGAKDLLDKIRAAAM
jgi:tripartite ATP-independent transporter DctP family solute receptor